MALTPAQEKFLSVIKNTEEEAMGTVVQTRDYDVELGRRMEFPLRTGPYPSDAEIRTKGMQAFPKYVHVMQATIRDVRLKPKMQRKGLFTALVQYLLERDEAVHVECVQDPAFIARFDSSPLWVRQSAPDVFNPCFARFEKAREPFTLF